MPQGDAATCASCAHFAPRVGAEAFGQCRRFPPQPHLYQDEVEDPVTGRGLVRDRWGAVWPVVDATDWCSEWSER